MAKNNITTWCIPPIDLPVQITQGFHGDTHKRIPLGERADDYSYCLDFLVDEGSPVYAALGGEVFAVEVDGDFHYAPKEGEPIDERLLQRILASGNAIAILHDDGTFANYGHLQQGGSFVKIGQRVEPGQKIGLRGNTGFSFGPHLHFGIFQEISERTLESVPFRLLDYDDYLEDREIKPAAYTNVVRTSPSVFPVDGRIEWMPLSELG
ncbi:MAG: M23 family metallopeptidase [Nanoarchaeota archaeon]|nr:M23 family metallopeptidase [Nanoarchaeota archaeon]